MSAEPAPEGRLYEGLLVGVLHLREDVDVLVETSNNKKVIFECINYNDIHSVRNIQRLSEKKCCSSGKQKLNIH